MQFAIADRFHVSPLEVDEWAADTVDDALLRMDVESDVAEERRQADERRRGRASRGFETLEDDWPELE